MDDLPDYTRGEAAVDRIVHAVGLLGALISTAWLIAGLPRAITMEQAAAVLIYCLGLIGMISASAAYNLAPPGPVKARLRRLDHAMIFTMIAGSYTPFALKALDPQVGLPLCVIVWLLAAIGIGSKLAGARCRERTWLALYLGMGWLLLPVFPWFIKALPGTVLALLIAGGAVYSLGAVVHAKGSMRFHNAVWHAMVLVGAGLHFAAVTRLFL